jgi:type IV secretory pathway VirB10-like protein
MRITALIVAATAALALTACQKAEEKAPDASSEAAEASGVADPAAANTTIDQAAADARAAAEAAGAAELAPAAAAAPAPEPEAAAH